MAPLKHRPSIAPAFSDPRYLPATWKYTLLGSPNTSIECSFQQHGRYSKMTSRRIEEVFDSTAALALFTLHFDSFVPQRKPESGYWNLSTSSREIDSIYLVDWLSPTLQVSKFLSGGKRAPDMVAVGFQELLPLHRGRAYPNVIHLRARLTPNSSRWAV